jgi:glucose dehydrogenase
MNQAASRRWTGTALLLFAVVLIGTGIIGIFRVSYIQHPRWIYVILPPIEVIFGTVLLLVPLLRRLMHEADEDEAAERRDAAQYPPPGRR